MQPSRQPTSQPSRQPSRQPSSQPSSQPISNPTNTPITSFPTANPSLHPTPEPSPFPTKKPSPRPSFRPSSLPTSVPTSLPTRLPTSQPSRQPSRQPYSQPTRQPSSQPMGRPTSAPSTSSPSATPSSSAPSSMPSTSSPSYMPQRAGFIRTAKPTFAPSATPSVKPSQLPTSTPTISIETKWLNKLNSIISTSIPELIVFDQSLMDYRQYVSKVVVAGNDLQNSCSVWKNYIENTLLWSLLTYEVVSFSMWQLFDDLEGSPRFYRCTDTDAVKQISNRLLNMSSNSITKVMCGGTNMWTIKRCNGEKESYSICVDCDDPCSSFTTSQQQQQALDLCSSSRKDEYLSGYLEGVVIDFKEPQPLPKITVDNIISNSTSLKVFVSTNIEAGVYCAAISSASGSILQSQESIVLSPLGGYVTSSPSPLSSSYVIIRNLDALTSYSVYCTGISTFGMKSSFATVLATERKVMTTCCKIIRFVLLQSFVPEGLDIINLATVFVSSAPSNGNLDVKLTLINDQRKVLDSSFSPNMLSIFSRSNSTQATEYAISLAAISRGSYNVSLELSGLSESEYIVEYSTTNQLVVYSNTSLPPVPLLSQAIFANDGMNIAIKFDKSTNKGGFGSMLFDCNLLFDFKCSATSTCTWADPTTALAYIQGFKACATVGDTISIQKDANVTAECNLALASILPCSEYSVIAADKLIAIFGPPDPIVPVVSVSAPETIGNCDPFTIDLTSSFGSAGRAWETVSIDVSVLRLSMPVEKVGLSALQEFFTSSFIMSPPTPVPPSLLSTGVSYNFAVTLCNFLKFCSTANHRLLVLDYAVPLVNIVGLSTRTVYRNTSLLIDALSQINVCKGGNSTTRYNGFDYKWDIYLNSVLQPSISNLQVSKNPSILKLPAYSLRSGLIYEIKLTVLFLETGKSSAVSCFVNVQRSEVAVVVERSNVQFWIGDSAVIDASKSRDLDISSALSGVQAGLVFSYSCSQVAPILLSTCPSVRFVPTERVDIVRFFASNVTSYSYFKVTVTVMDSSKSRKASTIVNVEAIIPIDAKLTILPIVGKINPSDEVEVNAVVEVPSPLLCDLKWKLDGYDIDALSLTPSSYKSIPYSALGKATILQLVINANRLVPGTFATFTLSSLLSNGRQSTASLSVAVNSVPRSGSYIINPKNGSELSTVFNFNSFGWHDEDLPLKYMFGFYSTSGSLMILMAKSENSFGKSVMPPGYVKSISQIFDCYSAYAYAYDYVSVERVANVSDVMQELLDGAFGNNNKMKQASSSIAISLNTANCSATTVDYCDSLFRNPCTTADNTCGFCYAGYIGNDLSSSFGNVPCVLPEAIKVQGDQFTNNVNTDSTKVLMGTDGVQRECFNSSDCEFWQYCGEYNASLVKCLDFQKVCMSNCSNNGFCKFINHRQQYQYQYQETCSVLSADCDAICECREGYTGGICDMTLDDLASASTIRNRLSDTLSTLLATDDGSDITVVNSWVSTINSISDKPDQLDDSLRSKLVAQSQSILDNLAREDEKVKISDDLLSFYDKIALSQVISQNRRRMLAINRRILGGVVSVGEDGGEDSTASISSVIENQLGSYASLLGNSMIGSQKASSSNSMFALTVQSITSSSATTTSDIEVSVPSSPLDILLGKNASSITISSDQASSSDGSLKISLVQLSPVVYPDSAAFETNVLQVKMNGSSSKGFTILQPHLPTGDDNNPYSYLAPAQFRTRCKFDDYSVHYYDCPDG
jgi:hypothetical protein